MASARDMPKSVLLHSSLVWRLQNKRDQYKPRNNHGGSTKACLDPDFEFLCADDGAERRHKDVVHKIYALNQETVDKYKENVVKVVKATGVDLEPAKGPSKPVEIERAQPVRRTVADATKPASQVAVGVTEIFH